jgi:hypothetical protein
MPKNSAPTIFIRITTLASNWAIDQNEISLSGEIGFMFYRPVLGG